MLVPPLKKLKNNEALAQKQKQGQNKGPGNT